MSKHTAVFVFDEELKTIVIESLDGVRYVPEKPTITTAHSSLITREDQTPDNHELIGKWVQCVKVSSHWSNGYKLNEWYEVGAENGISRNWLFDKDADSINYFFDVNNPKDLKPHPIPAEIREGLMLLPTDHPEYGNIREEAMEAAEKTGGWKSKTEKGNIISKAIHNGIDWESDGDYGKWLRIYNDAKSGAFDPKPVLSTIDFDIERFRKGEYEKIVTRYGREVTKLTDFEDGKMYPLVGLVNGKRYDWGYAGNYLQTKQESNTDLFLVINKQK